MKGGTEHDGRPDIGGRARKERERGRNASKKQKKQHTNTQQLDKRGKGG